MSAEQNLLGQNYFSVGQMRVDLWNQLKTSTKALANHRYNGSSEAELMTQIRSNIEHLRIIEQYFSFPGIFRLEKITQGIDRGEYKVNADTISELTRMLVSEAYRSTPDNIDDFPEGGEMEVSKPLGQHTPKNSHSHYFEVLLVEDMPLEEKIDLKRRTHDMQVEEDKFFYDLIIVPTFQDALIALRLNSNIQAVVIRYAPAFASANINSILHPFLKNVLRHQYAHINEADLGPLLGAIAKRFRTELDIYYVTDTSLSHLKDSTLNLFRRIFYRREDVQEMHLAIIRGIRERYEAPFYAALTAYSRKPIGVFHAMPISRGNSVFKSHWIRSFGDFYGRNMFLAESSSTTGGLDSLLQPTGSLKQAQLMASRAYGSRRTFFVTNGTSTANKIVLQALVQPGDLVLVDRDCHKSHHYGLVLSGAFPVYLDSYPIQTYSMYGAVPLSHIKDKLLTLKAAGRLDKVKMLLLTNCTFDGLVYNVRRVMEEILAIKPDMIFLWDEAWFAFATFSYTYKQRTAMYSASRLYDKYKTEAYRKEYEAHMASLAPGEIPRMPNPDEVKIRVYSTHSTHKTLSSFRQGSMIHVWDEEFGKGVSDSFHEAYMTHTSTSPNYQILASLDIGRRQVQFEGYELVEKSLEMAMVLRAKISDHPLLSKYFSVLTIKDFIPDEYRSSGLEEYYSGKGGWNRLEEAWAFDEFVLDPTKITLSVGTAGIDGDTFKNKYLMDQFNIQINKTSRNTVLFMTNIGTTRGSVAYLINCLLQIAHQVEEQVRSLNNRELEIRGKKIKSLIEDVPPLPDFSRFHSSFQAVPGVPGGDIRQAYFLSYDESRTEYIPLKDCLQVLQDGGELVSSNFVIPYPPGFPVLVPGQVVSEAILEFLLALDVKEIHGYREELGLKVFKQSALNRQKTISAMSMKKN